MSYLKLIKLLYLADREALLRWGRPVSTDRFVSMDRGPVLSRVLDLITGDVPPGPRGVWNEYVSAPFDFEVRLVVAEPQSDELSVAEEKLIREIFEKYGKMSRWSLVDLTHSLPEWEDPQGSAIPIEVRDILRAGGKTELEITAIEAELESVAAAETLEAASKP